MEARDFEQVLSTVEPVRVVSDRSGPIYFGKITAELESLLISPFWRQMIYQYGNRAMAYAIFVLCGGRGQRLMCARVVPAHIPTKLEICKAKK